MGKQGWAGEKFVGVLRGESLCGRGNAGFHLKLWQGCLVVWGRRWERIPCCCCSNPALDTVTALLAEGGKGLFTLKGRNPEIQRFQGDFEL